MFLQPQPQPLRQLQRQPFVSDLILWVYLACALSMSHLLKWKHLHCRRESKWQQRSEFG